MKPNPLVDVAILRALHLQDQDATIRPHGHSGFSSTFKLITRTKNGQQMSYFVKTGTGEDAEQMFKDFLHLDAGFHAKDLGSGPSLAAKLAKLHTTPAPTPEGHSKPMFGFPVSTCCGKTAQDNTWKASWAVFYAENRLRGILTTCLQNQGSDAELSNTVQSVADKVVPRLIGDETVKNITPVLVHGDLWSGNCAVGRIAGREGAQYEVVVFDPAAVYGHSEYELGMMKMFGGGFGARFWEEYEELVPKAEPRAEWEDRLLLYEL
ncbi:hypothetical protein E4U43_000834 [Claviceps pusilla]|uniref:protein-ribulosamine 3-kinase n=1 Tax=Claviceps pusilla TaxID=123648 RepID=A0A9P7N9C6_9HYPO|nr:hypothetical protein E4U43_000834 [Claviceps pusilla]